MGEQSKRKINRKTAKRVGAWLCLFLLSGVRLYGDTAPFGLPALLATDEPEHPAYLLAFCLGVWRAEIGMSGFLRQMAAAAVLLILRRTVKKRFADSLYEAFSVLICGAVISLLRQNPLTFLFSGIEAAVGAVFCPVFSQAGKTLESRQNTDVIGFSSVLLTLFVLSLGFADVEPAGFSVTASLLSFIGISCAFRQELLLASVCNTAIGFFFFTFCPAEFSVVGYFAAAGFLGAAAKRFGKPFVPLTFLLCYPVFLPLFPPVVTLALSELVVAALAFLAVPASVFDVAALVPVKREERSFARLTEKLGELSDTFSSISESFSYPPAPVPKDDRAASQTVQTVCTACGAKNRCDCDAGRELSGLADALARNGTGTVTAYPESIGRYCHKKKELMREFLKNYQLARMETLWQKRFSEESEAVSGQMKCISDVLSKLSCETGGLIARDAATEKELKQALRKAGVNVKNLLAGRGHDRKFEVILQLVPCKKAGLCDTRLPELIREVTGVEVERFGVKNCERCRVCYCESTRYRMRTAEVSFPLEKESGDSTAFARIDERHFAMSLCDGMGTGREAGEVSRLAVHLAMRLLSAGMDMDATVHMLNSLLLSRLGGKKFVTLDMAIIDLDSGECRYLKNGAATGYIFTGTGKVLPLLSAGSPLGAIGRAETEIRSVKLSDGDILLMLSDGVTDAFGENAEARIAERIGEFTCGTPEDLSAFVATAARNAVRTQKDDMTVVAVGCIKHHKMGNTQGKGGIDHEKRSKSHHSGQYPIRLH